MGLRAGLFAIRHFPEEKLSHFFLYGELHAYPEKRLHHQTYYCPWHKKSVYSLNVPVCFSVEVMTSISSAPFAVPDYQPSGGIILFPSGPHH